MTIGFYTIIISPHQLPVAEELASRVGADSFRYVYSVAKDGERERLGWSTTAGAVPFRVQSHDEADARAWLEDCDLLIVGGLRPIDLIERRLARGKKVFYMSERWFKPVPLFGSNVLVPGWIRLFVPSYFRMARRFARLFENSAYRYLPIGPWAARDMRLLTRVFGEKGADRAFLPWGYFVAPGNPAERTKREDCLLRILWVGRMLKLKRVETLVRAVRRVARELPDSVVLTLVGNGPEQDSLKAYAHRHRLPVEFAPSQPIGRIRELMRENDVYVFTSNGMDGWGAVVSEALEEGMSVFGTDETGASAAMLPKENRFHVGDDRALAAALLPLARARKDGHVFRGPGIGDWSAARGSARLLATAAQMD